MTFAQSLTIDRNRSQPLYRQIAEQIRVQIGEGRLPPGTQLPTVRQLATMLGVTRVTAQNAYSELQSGGWVESTVGRGTFVTASPQNQDLLAAVGRQITPNNVIGDMQHISKIVGLRSFAHAEPDPTLFPIDDFWNSLSNQAENLTALMRYGPTQGDDLLRIELGMMLAEQGISAVPDDVLVTTGVSQGLSLATQCLAPAGSCVIVEQPAYLGMLHILSAQGVQPIGAPLDQDGLRLDIVEQLIKAHQPRFIYTVPSFQNPTGICVSLKRRQELLALAEHYDLPIVEDDLYAPLAYGDEQPVPLKAMDRHGIVIYLSGFSKILMPGLRLGFMVIPPKYRERLISLRRAADLSGSLLLQRALANFLHRGRLKIHLRRTVPYYRERRDALLRALCQSMPADVSWTHPAGGFCCWLTLPPERGYSNLYRIGLENGIAFTPGSVFLLEPDDAVHLRLCFGANSPEIIQEGVEILGRLLRADYRAYQFKEDVAGTPVV